MQIDISKEDKDEFFMREALLEARKAWELNEVPVGAVIVKDDIIIARGHNMMITNNDPSAHAEMMAIRAAGITLQNYRMLDTTLYVTLEPCVMCSGVIIHSRINRVVYGACDLKTGAVESAFTILTDPKHNSHPLVTKGVLADECSSMLSEFFAMRRKQKKAEKQKASIEKEALGDISSNA